MNVCSWQAGMVTLYGGEQVPSDSGEWLAECEARYILSMDQTKRADFFQLVSQRRGADAGQALKARCYELEPHYVLALPNLQQRRTYLAAVDARFGRNPTDALKAKITALHASQQVVAQQAQRSA